MPKYYVRVMTGFKMILEYLRKLENTGTLDVHF